MSEETRIAGGPMHRIQIGTRLNDTYEIDGLIGVGGMGEVYKAHVIETGDEVAIKTILPEFAQNASALALFRNEASALHNLYHEAIVRYFVFSIDKPLGMPYLAMEYVEGETLSDALRRGPLAIESLLVLMRRLATGLGAAHALGIVHRDLSPDNVILPNGDLARAKIIDFGIARLSLGDKTVIGAGFAGKFSYVSPEQLGLQGGEVTGRSDIYSLGLTLAHAALGRALDMGQTHAEVIEKRRTAPELDGVDARVRPLLTAMLQPRPEDRPATMAEVAAWKPATAGGRPRARRLAAGLAAVLLLAGAVGTTAVLAPRLLWGPSPHPAPVDGGSDGGETLPPKPVPGPLADGDGPEPKRGPVRDGDGSPTPSPAPEIPRPLPKPTPMLTMETVAAFIAEYRGGDCFFISPVSVSHREAVIEGYGASVAPFATLDSDFKQALGFEPRIQLRQVSEPQCPAIELLIKQAGQRRSRVPKLAISRDLIRSGEELTGTAEAGGEPHLELLLVDEAGIVHNISSRAKPTRDGLAFALRFAGPNGSSAPKPQLVLAVASSKPLSSLGQSRSADAASLFRQVEEEGARVSATVGLAVRYFKFGG